MNNEDVINILRVIDYWIGLFNTWKVLKSDYVIFASDDKDVIRIISHNLSSFDRLGKIFVVAASWDIDEEIRNNTDVEYNFIVAEYKMIEALNKIPSIYYIFDNIYRSSFDGEDIDGYKLVGVEGITIEDIIKFGVLRLGRMPLESKDRSIYLYKEFENIKRELFEILPIGKRIYKDICSNTSEKIIFISPLPGTGDIFLLSMYLREYINRYNVEEYLLYVTNDHLRKLADLMGIKASVMDGESMKAFYTWRRINDLSYPPKSRINLTK